MIISANVLKKEIFGCTKIIYSIAYYTFDNIYIHYLYIILERVCGKIVIFAKKMCNG